MKVTLATTSTAIIITSRAASNLRPTGRFFRRLARIMAQPRQQGSGQGSPQLVLGQSALREPGPQPLLEVRQMRHRQAQPSAIGRA